MNAPARIDPLTRLRSAGLSVTLEWGRLIVRPASTLDDDNRQTMREHRAVILAALESERAELTTLVRVCGDAYDLTEAEHSEALSVALADPVAALECFRHMAKNLATNPTPWEAQDYGKVSHDRR